MNGFSHTPALSCEVPVSPDENKTCVDMLDPAEIFTLFFGDVMFSEEIQDVDFAEALTEMPPQVKDETRATIYEALSEFVPDMEEMDKKIGPVHKSMDDILTVVDSSASDSQYMRMRYTKAVAQTISTTLNTHDDNPDVHPAVVNDAGDTLDSVLSTGSS